MLDGGAGSDLFVFAVGSGNDTVYGFDDALDRIDLPNGGAIALSDVERGLRIDHDDGAYVLLAGETLAVFDTDALI